MVAVWLRLVLPLPSRAAKSLLIGLPPVDVSVINGGGIRADLPAGDITVNETNAVLPYNDTLVVLNVTGAAVSR